MDIADLKKKMGLKLKKRDKDQPKKKFKGTGLKIVDDDDFSYGASRRSLYSSNSNANGIEDDDEDEHRDAEELPQIVGVVDDRPELVQTLEQFSTANKWKQVGGPDTEQINNLLAALNNKDKDSRVESESSFQSGSKNSRVEDYSPKSTSSKASSTKKTLDGKRAGLQKASALREEMIEHRRRENEIFAKMDASISGKNAETKVRDRRSAKEREEDSKKKEEEEKFNKERKEQYDKWGKGLKQVESQQHKVNEALHEISKPLARYRDDEDLDAHLKAQDREGDPMLAMLSKKKSKRSGQPTRPKYSGPQPLPNRFHIAPGYRWDGVDRSNGYEKEWFNKINSRKALEEESYKWSVEDL